MSNYVFYADFGLFFQFWFVLNIVCFLVIVWFSSVSFLTFSHKDYFVLLFFSLIKLFLCFSCNCCFLCFFFMFLFLYLFNILTSPLFHHPSLVHSLLRVVTEVVACPFASPPPPTPFPMLLQPWQCLQSSPPPLLQIFHPPTPLLPPACLSRLREIHSLGAFPKPWRQYFPSTLPPLCPQPGSGGPAYLPCSPPL